MDFKNEYEIVNPQKPDDVVNSNKSEEPLPVRDVTLIISSNKRTRSLQALSYLAQLTYCVAGMYSSPSIKLPQGKLKGKGKGKNKGKSGKKQHHQTDEDGGNWSIYSGTIPHTKIPRFINNRPYRVTQEVQLAAALTTSNAVATFGAIFFTVSQLDQIISFGALFDQYRFFMIEVWFEPQFVPNNSYSEYATVIDYDDDTALTTYASALDYQNVVVTQLQEGQYRCFQPHIAVASYSGLFTSFANEAAPWIDAASTGVRHYGIKLAAQVAAGTGPIVPRCRFHVEWRNLR